MNDLVAEEALLHKRCNTNFSRESSFNTDGAGGRKQDDFRLELFDELCTWLETELKHSLFTLEQIHQKMISMDKSPDKSLVYSQKHLRNMLVDRYQEKMYFTSQERRTDVLCFKDMSASSIREYHDNTEDGDKTKLINTAVKLIKNEILLLEIDRSVYPSITEMIDPDRQLELVPESVTLLLRPLLKSDIKVAFWGQNLIRCSRPRSGVVPLPLRFALQLDHRLGSKWLLNELHLFDLCKSYNETSQYKYNYIRNTFHVEIESNQMETILEVVEEGNDDVEEGMVDDQLQSRNEMIDDVSVESDVDHAETPPPNVQYSGVQYVVDNIDLNNVSINGNAGFHAMGMIKVNSKSSSMTDEYLNSKLSRLRLKPSDRATILRAGDIPIKLCVDPKKSGIDSIKFESSNLLHDFAPTPAELNPADIIWAAGWIIKKSDDKCSHANWNGWMKNVHNSSEKSPSSIVYQPIIDSNPNDYSTINSALLRCIQLENPNYAVITFDLPVWLKAVDLILSQGMPIIPRLGGFHLLKSYLAIFGVLFADSGLHDIIKLIYEGELAADSILNGNSYDKAIRAHFLIDAVIFQHVNPASIFTDNEPSLMKTIILDCSKNHAGIGSKDIPMAERFRSKIKNVLAQLDNAGRTPSLWCLYHYMVDTIKIFIRAERMGDFTLHLSCITNRMLHMLAAAGHHDYAKAARLYVQMMKTYEKGSDEEIAIISSFKENRNHVVRYSSSE